MEKPSYLNQNCLYDFLVPLGSRKSKLRQFGDLSVKIKHFQNVSFLAKWIEFGGF